MDMHNNRFEGEKRLAEELGGHDSGYNESELLEFEALLDDTKPKGVFWTRMLSLGLVILIGFSVGWYASQKNSKHLEKENMEALQNKEVQKNIQDPIANQEKAQGGRLENDPTINIASNQTTLKTKDKSYEAITLDKEDDQVKRGSIADNTVKSHTTFEKRSNSKSGTERIDDQNSLTGNANGSNLLSDSQRSNSLTSSEGESLSSDVEGPQLAHRPNLEIVQILTYLQDDLEYKRPKLEGPLLTVPIVDIVKKKPKRKAFGIQYNVGTTHPGFHETPFISPSPTRNEGVRSYGYGLFGVFNFNPKSFIRASFTYNNIGHRQIVEELRFQTGETSIVLNLHAHELMFGVDYGYRLMKKGRFGLNVGGGLAYHNTISLESNNYFVEFELEVGQRNELKRSPVSLKTFASLDIQLYKDITLGVEPYLVYQKRKARYTNSTFLADDGTYNFTSGVNFTLKF